MPRWRHQEAAYQFAKDREATMLAMWMGTGKSRVACDLLKYWKTQRVLVLCPVSVMAVWRREFCKWAPLEYLVKILDKGTTKRQAEIAAKIYNEPEPIAVVQNYESAIMPAFRDFLLGRAWDAIVLDESHRVKAHNTKVSRLAASLSQRGKRRLCLTGTPMPHSPLDVFGQCRFLDYRVFGRNWMPFLYSFAVRGNPMIPQQITGYRNLDVLQERFGRLAYQVDASVLELPEAQHHVRAFSLPAKALRVYNDLARDFIAALDDGEVVTAANVLVKTLRLRQVVSGFLQPDESDALQEIHDGKKKLLKDLLEDLIGEPVVVFCEFSQDLRIVREVAGGLGLTYGEVSGRQKDLTEHATMPEGIDVLGVQYQAGGVGVDFTRARYCVFYSPTYSLGNYDQAAARLHRPGQEKCVQFYHLVASGTIDEAVYKALDAKRDVIESVLGALRARQAA